MKETMTCNFCVMDNSDPNIVFNSNGECNHCIDARKKLSDYQKDNYIQDFINKLKQTNSKYDCILGLSGGLDSSYLALKMKEWGINPLVLHIDAGWNSELAVQNIQKILDYTGFDFESEIIDWDSMKNLQLAFLKSGYINQDAPQDHIFFSKIYKYASKNKIKYIVNGFNFKTESILPRKWVGHSSDPIILKNIFYKYGKGNLNYETSSLFRHYFWYPIVKKLKIVYPLTYIDFDEKIAISELKKIGFKPYENKHEESLFTKFYQNYYLVEKFNIDKRKAHLSSKIVSGLISRDEALNIIKHKPLYSRNELKSVINKLEISETELDDLMKVKNKYYGDFKNWEKQVQFLKRMKHILKLNLKFYKD